MGGRVDRGACGATTAVATMVSVKDGNWNDSATWSCGRVLVLIDAVEVQHAVTLPEAYAGQAAQIGYGAGGRLLYQPGARIRLGF